MHYLLKLKNVGDYEFEVRVALEDFNKKYNLPDVVIIDVEQTSQSKWELLLRIDEEQLLPHLILHFGKEYIDDQIS